MMKPTIPSPVQQRAPPSWSCGERVGRFTPDEKENCIPDHPQILSIHVTPYWVNPTGSPTEEERKEGLHEFALLSPIWEGDHYVHLRDPEDGRVLLLIEGVRNNLCCARVRARTGQTGVLAYSKEDGGIRVAHPQPEKLRIRIRSWASIARSLLQFSCMPYSWIDDPRVLPLEVLQVIDLEYARAEEVRRRAVPVSKTHPHARAAARQTREMARFLQKHL